MDISYTRPLMPKIEDYEKEIKSIWENHYLTNSGPKVKSLESKLEEYLEVENVGCFVNGHLALDCALKALEIKGEVITTPFTFISTIMAMITNGITPVFCDIDPNTFNINPDKIEELITDKTEAIVAVHVFGYPCDVERLEEIAKRHNLKLIFDAAHAFGVRVNGRSVLSYGDISMISFHATKVFNSIEGGALVFKDESLYNKLKSIHNFGYENGDVIYYGTNAKMNEFSASMGLLNLKLVEEEMQQRKRVFESYTEKLSKIPGIKVPEISENIDKYNYSYYPVIIDKDEYGYDSKELYDFLLDNGIVSRRYFYPACNEMGIIKKLNLDTTDTPNAKKISDNILTLPIYSALDEEKINYITSIIKGIRK